MEETLLSNTFPLQIDNSNIPYLSEAARWGKFLSILGFIFITIMLIVGLLALFSGGSFTSSELDTEFQDMQLPPSIAGVIIGIYILIVAILYFFPCLYLYNFSSKMQAALKNNDQVNLNVSFKNLKSLFKFWGVLTIIILSIWILALLFGVLLTSAFTH